MQKNLQLVHVVSHPKPSLVVAAAQVVKFEIEFPPTAFGNCFRTSFPQRFHLPG
jgi:hypothetical protein